MKIYRNIICLMAVFVMMSCNSTDKNGNNVTVVLDSHAKLGEGALWDILYKRLLWVDIESGIVNIYDPDKNENRTVAIGQKVGTVVPVDDDSLVVALVDGIYTLDLITDKLTFKVSPEDTALNNRFNDGKCDPAGRLWAGTMSGKRENGGLYRIDPDFSAHKMIDSVRISNGIAWSLDKTKMYYIDTPTRQVVSYDYDNQTGEISNRRVAIEIPDSLGSPDGSTLDAEGKLWIAMWGGSCVTRWDPETGEFLDKIDIPARNVTSVAFGGENLETLYITSASVGMSDDDRAEYPLAGSVFAVKPGVRGIPCSYFGMGMPEQNQ